MSWPLEAQPLVSPTLLAELKLRIGTSRGDGHDTIKFPLTQQDIGDYLGLTNITVSRTLSKLEDAGCLDFKQGEIRILNFEHLKKCFMEILDS